MLVYTRFIVLESSHISAQIEAFLREKGFDVMLIESADMLPVADDESWKEITVVVDIDKAGKEGLSVIEKNGRFVVLTSRPSRITSLFSVASRFGWELMIKPYLPEMLLFRVMRLWDRDSYSPPELPAPRKDVEFRELAAEVVKYLPAGMMVVDKNNKIFSVNDHGSSIVGLDREEILGRDITRLFGLKKGDNLSKALGSGATHTRIEQHVSLSEERTLVLGLSTAILGTGDDNTKDTILMFRDISGEKRMHERFRRTEQLASLGAMAAGMAHEIRNPLASMLTGVQILGNLPAADPRAERHRQTIIQQITRLNGIVRDLLTLGRPARTKRKQCSVERIIQRALDEISSKALEQKIEIQKKIADNLPTFSGDEGQIRQVLLNLFLNAMEAMPKGGMLQIKAMHKRSSDLVSIEVSDTGMGMSQEDITNAFTPFFSTKAQGSGLGLSVCNRIIADHDGQLELTSRVRKGTKVVVELPTKSTAVKSRSSGDNMWNLLYDGRFS